FLLSSKAPKAPLLQQATFAFSDPGFSYAGAIQSQLTQANVVNGFHALTPCINARPVKIASGCSVLHEKRERLGLIYPLLTYCISVNDSLRPNLIRILIQVKVIAAHVRSWVINAPNLALLPDLNFIHNRVNGRGRVVDVANRTRWWDGL